MAQNNKDLKQTTINSFYKYMDFMCELFKIDEDKVVEDKVEKYKKLLMYFSV